jgi:hypothetical protein
MEDVLFQTRTGQSPIIITLTTQDIQSNIPVAEKTGTMRDLYAHMFSEGERSARSERALQLVAEQFSRRHEYHVIQVIL